MVDEALAQTSNTLFNAAFIIYIVAMVAFFFRLAFTKVSVAGTPTSTKAGDRVGIAATALVCLGVAAHAGSVLTRALAAGRFPLGNMYEYSSAVALFAVAFGVVYVQRKLGYGHLMGFVIAAAILMMASGLLLFTEAGPLVPALDSYWLKIHVSAMMASSSVFIVGFAFTALYLVKDTAERRLADDSGSSFAGSTVGAAQVPTQTPAGDDYRPEDYVAPGSETRRATATAGPLAQRETLSPVAFPVVPFVVVAAFTFIVWRGPLSTLIAGSVAALLGIAAWYAVPYLPPAARLDSLAYRIVAFGFPIITFGVLCGAIWAQEAWGRYWGWDPKETGSFFTWVLYAAYLHARSTHGWRGRGAGWIGVVAFFALMVTYYVVNLFVVGLHSYAGV